jgi:hypothetical protein
MAAPLGFKTFNTGDVLSAADTNGYLMQGVLVFADAAARSAAITSPQEGQTSYLKDTDVIQVYSGSAWVTKSGGSSPLTTKGDLYTYSTTDARLPVGTNGHTLVANSSTATGLEWQAPAGSSGPTFRAFANSTPQSLTQSVLTKVTWSAETWDTDSYFASSTFTPLVAGYYLFTVGIGWDASPAGLGSVQFFKNGSVNSIVAYDTVSNGAGNQTGSAIIYCNGTTDYIEVYGQSNAATSRSVYQDGTSSWFSGVWIRS